jgi:hypothetical protein
VTGKYYYRLEDYLTCDYGEANVRVAIRVLQFPVISKTPKGVWIQRWPRALPNFRRFILTSARKRFACPTLEEARESYLARKWRQASILHNRYLKAVEAAELSLVEAEIAQFERRQQCNKNIKT